MRVRCPGMAMADGWQRTQVYRAMLQSKPAGLTQVHRDDPLPPAHSVSAPAPAPASAPAYVSRSDPEGDEALLTAAQAGDEAAFASIYDLWSGSIASYLYRLTGSREVADDLTQDTFLRAWRALGRIDAQQHVHLRPWLFRIATNLARSHHRRQRLRTWLPFTAATEPSVPDLVDQQVEAVLLAQALHAVGPTHRSVLLLRHHLHLPLDEVASALGISENTAKVRLYRARRAFVSAWHDLTVDPSPPRATPPATAPTTTTTRKDPRA